MERDFTDSFKKQLDNIDNEILILLKRRFQIAKKFAKYKHDRNREVFDINEGDNVIKSVIAKSIIMNISESFIRRLFHSIIDETKLQIEEFMEKKKLRDKQKNK